MSPSFFLLIFAIKIPVPIPNTQQGKHPKGVDKQILNVVAPETVTLTNKGKDTFRCPTVRVKPSGAETAVPLNSGTLNHSFRFADGKEA